MRDNTEDTALLPQKKEDIRISYLPDYCIEDYDLSDPKENRRYFFDIERICRNSYSYKRLINFLREHVSMNKCSFYKNINNIDTYSLKIHIHHAPLTLFDIVTTVYSKRVANREPLSPNMVAREVMWNHYMMHVGLIPLSETVHELVHSGFLFIPIDKVFGRYGNFMQLYGNYIDPNLKATLDQAEKYSMAYDYAKETKVLTMQMVHIDPSGAYELPSYEELANVMRANIDNFDKKIDQITYTGGETRNDTN